MTLADISYQENEFGREEIKDGTKYVYSDAYGLTGTDTFLVYMEEHRSAKFRKRHIPGFPWQTKVIQSLRWWHL